MEKRDFVLSQQATPILWAYREAALANGPKITPPFRLGRENEDGSRELFNDDMSGTPGRYIDVMAMAPDGRRAIINFHGCDRTTHFGELSLEEAEEIFGGRRPARIDAVAE